MPLSILTTNGLALFQRIVRPFNEFGLVAGALYALNRLFRRLSSNLRIQIHDWMVQPITAKPLLPERFARSFVTREIEKDDPAILKMPIRPEILKLRLRQNTKCLGTYDRKNRLVGYVWLSFDTYEEDQARCTFVLSPPDHSVFDFDLRVSPDYQMGIGFAALWHGVNRYLFERSVRFSFSRLDRFNQASAKAHNHLGWKRVGWAVIFQLWRTEVMLMSRMPWFYLSLGESARARIQLTPEVLHVEQ